MEEKHNTQKTFECNVCGKMFLLKWTLQKHVEKHNKKTKDCTYILKKEPCPFSDIGCKFVHNDLDPAHMETDEYSFNEN